MFCQARRNNVTVRIEAITDVTERQSLFLKSMCHLCAIYLVSRDIVQNKIDVELMPAIAAVIRLLTKDPQQ